MGYAVYWTPEHNRWEGYAVPAQCDWPSCRTQVDRGLAYRCEDHGGYKLMLDGAEISYSRFHCEPAAEEEWEEEPGCELTFCDEHRAATSDHHGVSPKGELPVWEEHMLRDESWAEWRQDNPDMVGEMAERLARRLPTTVVPAS